MTADGFVRKRRRPVRLSLGATADAGVDSVAAVCTTSLMRLAVPDPWIDEGVQDVDGEVEQHEDARHHQDCSLNEGVVARADRLIQLQPDARPAKDGLGDSGAAQ